MKASAYVGRVGGLAVALGIGAVLASGSWVASAETGNPTDSGTGVSSAGDTTSRSTPGAPTKRSAPRSKPQSQTGSASDESSSAGSSAAGSTGTTGGDTDATSSSLNHSLNASDSKTGLAPRRSNRNRGTASNRSDSHRKPDSGSATVRSADDASSTAFDHVKPPPPNGSGMPAARRSPSAGAATDSTDRMNRPRSMATTVAGAAQGNGPANAPSAAPQMMAPTNRVTQAIAATTALVGLDGLSPIKHPTAPPGSNPLTWAALGVASRRAIGAESRVDG